MENYSTNGMAAELASYETPFADEAVDQYEEQGENTEYSQNYLADLESPFSQNFDSGATDKESSPLAANYVQLLGGLNDQEFSEALYQMASEVTNSWSDKVSNEAAMGDRFVPFATQQAQQYFAPLIDQAEATLDRIRDHFTATNLSDHSETEIENYFAQFETPYGLSPAQEQFLGGLIKKVKSVVSTAGNLVKKGINVVGKFLPIGPILDKIKRLIPHLLNRVLKFAIGKLPVALRPHAQNLAKRFLKMEAVENLGLHEATTPDLESIQMEFDNQVANLVFSQDENEAEQYAFEFEHAEEMLQRETADEAGGLHVPSLDAAREQLINELRDLKDGESPAPAIERFLPAAILALQPVIKVALSIIGRQKVINFLAGLLAKLVRKFVPENVARPLAASIIDVGMSAIGFEVNETTKSDVAYEAIVNTIQETVQRLGNLSEHKLNDQEAFAAEVVQAFEAAAPNNFPAKYIRKDVLPSTANGIWVLKPRKGPKHLYKKYTNVFNTTIEPRVAKSIRIFGGRPLSSFLKENLSLDVSKPIQARVHLYEAINGTQLSNIAKHEKTPGLSVQHGYVQLHPLSMCNAAMLIKEPGLGEDVDIAYRTSPFKIKTGQRFFYLEIAGAKLKYVVPQPKKQEPRPPKPTPIYPIDPKPVVAKASDIQCILNLLKGEIKVNYFFSEAESIQIVEKLKAGDYLGAAYKIKAVLHDVLHNALIKNIGSKVKIIHEAIPELYLDNYIQSESKGGGLGKDIMMKVIEKLIEKLVAVAFDAVGAFFKARAAEFIKAQAEPADGVTVKLRFFNIPGLSQVSAIINGLRGTLSIGNVLDFAIPSIPSPDIDIKPGQVWD